MAAKRESVRERERRRRSEEGWMARQGVGSGVRCSGADWRCQWTAKQGGATPGRGDGCRRRARAKKKCQGGPDPKGEQEEQRAKGQGQRGAANRAGKRDGWGLEVLPIQSILAALSLANIVLLRGTADDVTTSCLRSPAVAVSSPCERPSLSSVSTSVKRQLKANNLLRRPRTASQRQCVSWRALSPSLSLPLPLPFPLPSAECSGWEIDCARTCTRCAL